MSEHALEEQELGTNGVSDVDEPEPEAPAKHEASHLGRLRAKRTEKVTEKTIDLDIPGYDGDLVCRYHALDFDGLKAIGDKLENLKVPDSRREFWGYCDTLIAACEGFFVRDAGELQPLDPDDPQPLRYDNRLARALGIPEQRGARSVVVQVFDLAVSPEVAIVAQHIELAQWMESATQEADEELLGES